jgi:DNA repair protein RecO (recombination protein O)
VPLYRDRGVVVSGFRLGEADKVLTLLTEGHGIVRAVAKGVRKTRSRFGGRLEPLSHVSVIVYRGRSLDVISQVETITPWRALRSSPPRLRAGFALAEAALRISHEQEPAPRAYRLLAAGLTGLESLSPELAVPPLYVTVFLLRILEVAGLALAVDACATCGAGEVTGHLSVADGGVLCARCAGPGSYRVRPETLVLLGELSKGRIVEAATAVDGNGGSQSGAEAAALVRRFVEYHFETRLRAYCQTFEPG